MLVECSQRGVPGFACDLQNQAVRKSERRLSTVVIQRCRDDLGVLESKTLVVEQHVDRGCDGRIVEVVRSAQSPRRFREHEVRHPRSLLDEGFSRRNLPFVIYE